MNTQFEKKREELLGEIRDILTSAEELFDEKSKAGSEELKRLKESLNSRIDKAKQRFAVLQEDAMSNAKNIAKQTESLVQENPYKAIGVAGLIGLLLGVLISKK
ncbi:DUF883 family protein [Campylobacter curvus]|uniref:DUF883 family protein n=1 Tax=Campylobacter curvus TaxID=200 RepID=UPI00036F1E51|nr:DUF883 family protein [Campylobacter curvus]QKF60963.1 DUF883 domain-containing protein [Campylobacter curvus]UEB49280.1 DUF883 family protein [Campylobacter curvus]